MKLDMVSKVLVGLALLAPIALPRAWAQDDKGTTVKWLNAKYDGCEQDANGHVKGIKLKDGTIQPVDIELPEADRKAIDLVILPLNGNEAISLLQKSGVVTKVEKGHKQSEFDQLDAALQKKIQELKIDDEIVLFLAKSPTYGRFLRRTDEGITVCPAVVSKGVGADVKLTYQKGYESTIAYHDLKDLKNTTGEERAKTPQPGGGDKPEPKTDGFSKIKIGDTIRIGFHTGVVVELTDTACKLREWKNGAWAEDTVIPRADGTPAPAALKQTRKYPLPGGAGDVYLDEERLRVGEDNTLLLRATVRHDQKEFVLAGAKVRFTAGSKDNNFKQYGESVALEPVFADELVAREKTDLQFDDGAAELEFDPAKNVIRVTQPEAKSYILAALATKKDQLALARVFDSAAKNGDPDLALILADRLGTIQDQANGDEKIRAALSEALQQFGEKGADALVDHVCSADGSFRVPEPDPHEPTGIRSRIEKDNAVALKKRELKLLIPIQGALKGDRGRKLFEFFQYRAADFSDALVDLFKARVQEGVDALLNQATALQHDLTDKTGEDARNLLRLLGDPALKELTERVRQLGQAGQVQAKIFEKDAQKKPADQVIANVLLYLVDYKRQELRESLKRNVEDAKVLMGQKKWEEALTILADVVKQDRDLEEARKLRTDCTLKVAELWQTTKRGPAAKLLTDLIDSGVRGKGAENRLGQMLIESAKEDAEASCVRAGPYNFYEVLEKESAGKVLSLAPVKDGVEGWIPVALAKGKVGWLATDLAKLAPDGRTCQVSADTRSLLQVRNLLKKVREMAPELTLQADALDGELHLTEARARVQAGEYAPALSSYKKAADYIPDDPRLAEAKWVWIQANKALLAVGAGGTVTVSVLLALALVRRQKKIKIKEFHYYGKDRAKAERDMDAGSAAPSSVEGEPAPGDPAPPAPTDAAAAPPS